VANQSALGKAGSAAGVEDEQTIFRIDPDGGLGVAALGKQVFVSALNEHRFPAPLGRICDRQDGLLRARGREALQAWRAPSLSRRRVVANPHDGAKVGLREIVRNQRKAWRPGFVTVKWTEKFMYG